jgi:cardiolipin synthase (CMP-forming)
MRNDWKIYMPNVITCLRIILSACLLLMNPDNISFLLIYGTCGLTDVVDGYLARRWKVSSKIGALLDSMADFIFIAVLLVIFIPRFDWNGWMLWWIVIIALIRGLSILIGLVKFHTIAFVHTHGNKVTGLMLFFFPFLFGVSGLTVTVIMICAAASISGVEELVITVYSNTLNRDRKGW